MKLSPLDLRKQQFKKKFGGGYDPDEVRGFIEKLASDWEDVLEDHRQAESRVREMEAKLKHYEKVELALQEALDAARETGRRAEESAERRARLIVEEAELRAQRILQDAEQERYNIRQDLVKLNSRQAEIGARLRAFLMSEMEILAQFQGDDPIGFIKLMSASEQAEQGALAGPKPRLAASAMPPAPEEPAAPPPLNEPLDELLDEPGEAEQAADETPLREPEAPAVPAPEMPEAPEESPPPAPAPSPPRYTTPLAPAPPESSHRPAEEPATEAAEEPAEADTPQAEVEESVARTEEPPSAPTYRDLLSGQSRAPAPADAEPPARPTKNPFTKSLFRSPFFREDVATGEDRPEVPAEPAPGSDAAQGWSLRSLVTGEEEEDAGNVVASEDERERIRRILNDLD